MLKLKSALVCSTLSLSLFALSLSANAEENTNQNPNQTTDVVQVIHSTDNTQATQQPTSGLKMGLYFDLGGAFSVSDMFSAKNEAETEEVTIGKGSGFAGDAGIRFNNFSVGVDVSNFSPDIVENTSSDTEKLGTVDTTLILAKITGEHNFDNHNTIYTSLGLGTAMYDINTTVDLLEPKFLADHTSAAIMIGMGYKVYFGQDKGIYLSAGLRYTKIFQSELKFTSGITEWTLTGGLGVAQGLVKLGYQF